MNLLIKDINSKSVTIPSGYKYGVSIKTFVTNNNFGNSNELIAKISNTNIWTDLKSNGININII